MQGVVFDMDDTLYLERDFVASGFRAVSVAVERDLGFPIADDLIARFEAGERGDLFTPTLTARLGSIDEDYVKSLVSVYRGHTPNFRPLPGIFELLTALKHRCRLALISDGVLSVQQNKLDVLGLHCFFAPVIFTDLWGREFWKPHPRGFLDCAQTLAIETRSMLYIADNPAKDFIGARRVGMATVRLRLKDGLHYTAEPDFGAEPDLEVHSVAELAQALLEAITTKEIG